MFKEPLSHVPLVTVAAVTCALSLYLPPLIGCTAFVVLLFSLIVSSKLRTGRVALSIAGVAAGLVLNFQAFLFTVNSSTGIPPESVHAFTGQLIQDSQEINRELTLYRVELKEVSNRDGVEVSAKGRVLLFVKGEEAPPLYQGEQVTVRGSLTPPDRRGEWHYHCWSWASRIKGDGIENRFYQLRSQQLKRINTFFSDWQSDTFGLFKALLLGVTDSENRPLKELFRRAGVTHILALSGFHVGVISAILSLLFLPLTGKRFLVIPVIPILTLYTLLVGPRPSLLRAVFMYFLAGVVLLADEKPNGKKILSLSFLILAAAFPSYTASLSFQLSFTALCGILYLSERVKFLITPLLPAPLPLLFSVSIGAQLACSPLLLSTFGELYPIGVVVSLIISPLITLFIFFGLTITAWELFLPALSLLHLLLEILYRVIYQIVQIGAKVPEITFQSKLSTVTAYILLATGILFLYSFKSILTFTVRKSKAGYLSPKLVP